MAQVTYREAVARGLHEALRNDPKVFLMGQDVGAYGGAYAVTRGFLEQYGPQRVKDTPISESAIVGAGTGAAMGGLRPIVEIMTINFTLMAMDAIVNHAAKVRYMSGGQLRAPVLLRTVTGGGAGLAATHSQSLEGWFATVPGLKVVVPSTPYDALGLLRACLKEEDPVLFVEHVLLYGSRGEVPDEYYEVPLGLADVKLEGTDVTLVATSGMISVVLEAAGSLAQRGVSAEVIDLRTLRPLDIDTVVASVQKTHHCLVVEEAWGIGSYGSYVAFLTQRLAFDGLDAPVGRLGGADVPMPYAASLEKLAIPDSASVLRAVEEQFGL